MILSNKIPSTTIATIFTAFSTAIAYLAGLDFDFSKIDWSLAYSWFISLTGAGAAVGWVTGNDNTEPQTQKPEPIGRDYDLTIPLGLRIHNPGNLKKATPEIPWRGKVGYYKGFVEFDSDASGLRAMARNLRNQTRLHGLNTIEGIIRKYAPDNENNTAAYISFIAKQMQRDPNEILDLENDGTLTAMMIPMIRLEQGQQPFSTEIIMDAVKLA